MIRHPLYGLFGLLLIALSAYVQYKGYGLSHVNEVKNVPRSVRDNPGAYRSVYGGYSRYSGGK